MTVYCLLPQKSYPFFTVPDSKLSLSVADILRINSELLSSTMKDVDVVASNAASANDNAVLDVVLSQSFLMFKVKSTYLLKSWPIQSLY